MTVERRHRWSLRTDHYEWITDYLSVRGLTTAVRLMMVLIAASLAVCLIALELSPDGPADRLPVVMTWTAFAGGLAGVALWAWRWPTHLQSAAFAVLSNASVALACLAYPDPQGALIGCISFATVAAYIAFFHSTTMVGYNLVVTAVVAVTAAVRLGATGHVARAAVDLFLVLQINIAMPLAISVLVRALGTDLVRADRDPLTGLLNRRAFAHQASKLLTSTSRDDDRSMCIALIDLDDFKRINDTHGHQAGDETLVAVANALRRVVAGVPAVVGRCGGEEFVIAAEGDDGASDVLAARVCAAIAESTNSVTASVGTACLPMTSAHAAPADAALEALFAAADAAMYEAKHAGGNGYRRHGG